MTGGQLNALCTEIKDILEDGIETTGAICTDGTPAFGGTGTGEDFAGFTIYATNLDDVTETDITNLPCIAFRFDKTPIEYFHDDNKLYASNGMFELRIPLNLTKTINASSYNKKKLMNWYVERLQYVLDTMQLTSVMEAGKMNPTSFDVGTDDEGTNFWIYGLLYFSITYMEEGDTQ